MTKPLTDKLFVVKLFKSHTQIVRIGQHVNIYYIPKSLSDGQYDKSYRVDTESHPGLKSLDNSKHIS